PSTPHEPPRWMRFPLEVLVVFCLIVGIIPGLSVGPLLHNSVQSVLGDMTPYYSLALWHGVNIPLLVSFAGRGGGVLLSTVLRVRFNLQQVERVPVLYRVHGRQPCESIMLEMRSAASRLERLRGTRRLQ